MQITRFVASSDGGSRLVEWDLPTDDVRTDAAGTVKLSRTVVAQQLFVAELSEGRLEDWHPAPSRQLIVVLAGAIEVETSDGATRLARAGEMLLADDCGTIGHRTRTVDGLARVLMIQLPPDREP